MSRHVLETCRAVDEARASSGVADFLADCTAQGVPKALHYSMYVNGLAPDGSDIDFSDYLERGAALAGLQDAWIACL